MSAIEIHAVVGPSPIPGDAGTPTADSYHVWPRVDGEMVEPFTLLDYGRGVFHAKQLAKENFGGIALEGIEAQIIDDPTHPDGPIEVRVPQRSSDPVASGMVINGETIVFPIQRDVLGQGIRGVPPDVVRIATATMLELRKPDQIMPLGVRVQKALTTMPRRVLAPQR